MECSFVTLSGIVGTKNATLLAHLIVIHPRWPSLPKSNGLSDDMTSFTEYTTFSKIVTFPKFPNSLLGVYTKCLCLYEQRKGVYPQNQSKWGW